eukprot:CAMPEP_0197020662 /NCGR_PEP_ID=MMETSP1384-20130603/1508_1 /TAXON_ID=29189 /ORGANISM="Ammonia sp." /LENGTH=294 /DNA_ID=CAMNT_0042448333 /DNA_START=50 /DNA_END=934 /DNA_ORIENTATION=+
MVLLHVKGVDKRQEFVYECSVKDALDSITRNVIQIYNLRLTLKVLCQEMKEMMKYGAMRSAQLRGLSAKVIEETIPDLKLDEDCDFDLDPTARRMGIPLQNEHVIQTLNELLTKIEAYLSSERVALRSKGVTKLSELEEFVNELRGALLIAYPMQLPAHDVLQQILIENVALQQADMNYSKEVHDVDTAQLWFASKKLLRGDVLSKYIGNNEKSKLVVKITKQTGNMPVREPVVDEETRKKMMAFWYKKQEQDKELKQDDDDSYLQTQWANTNALKQSFLGLNPEKIQYRTTDS